MDGEEKVTLGVVGIGAALVGLLLILSIPRCWENSKQVEQTYRECIKLHKPSECNDRR